MCKDISLSTYTTNAFSKSLGYFCPFLKKSLKNFYFCHFHTPKSKYPSTYITNTFLISWGHFGNFLKNNLKKFTQQKKKQAKTYFY